MSNRRRKPRWNLQLFVPLLDTDSNKTLGYIADVSDDGILVFSTEPIKLKQTFSLLIRLEDLKKSSLHQNIKIDKIVFKAETRWIDIDVKPSFNRTGLTFVEIAPESRTAIDTLIHNVAEHLDWNALPQ